MATNSNRRAKSDVVLAVIVAALAGANVPPLVEKVRTSTTAEVMTVLAATVVLLTLIAVTAVATSRAERRSRADNLRRRMATAPPIAERVPTLTDRVARARSFAVYTFSVLERIVPARLSNEELGDALECINLMGSVACIYAKVASTVLWLLLHAFQEEALAVLGFKKGS